MYERDHVHAKAMKTIDDSLHNRYRSLQTHVTKVIQENKLQYFKEINSLYVLMIQIKCGLKSNGWCQVNVHQTW